MDQEISFVRTTPPEPVEFTVSTKELYTLLRMVKDAESTNELTELKQEITTNDLFTRQQIQNLLDAALIWLAMPQSENEFSRKLRAEPVHTERLLKLGANPNTALGHGTTLLMLTLNDPLRLEMLLSLDEKIRPDLNRVDVNGDTALILAVYEKQHYAALMLLLAGANPGIRNKNGKKAIMYADEFSLTEKLEQAEMDWEQTDILREEKMHDTPFTFFQAPSRQGESAVVSESPKSSMTHPDT